FRLLQIYGSALHDQIASRHGLAGNSRAPSQPHRARSSHRSHFEKNPRNRRRARMNKVVVAVIATHRRHAELKRLLGSLEKIERHLAGVIVADNAGDAKAIVKNSRCNARWVSSGSNLGCGGGLALAEKTAFEFHGDNLTHLWVLDDDAV